MELTDVQKQAVRDWADEGLSLSDIQKRLAGEFNLSMTFMDVRFLVIDLGAELAEQAKGFATPKERHDAPAATGGAAPDPGLDAGAPAGGVTVDLDRITKPGAVVSGTVNFSDGTAATWALDQVGRLAIDAGTPGYRPSEEDLQTFQQELRTALEKRGF